MIKVVFYLPVTRGSGGKTAKPKCRSSSLHFIVFFLSLTNILLRVALFFMCVSLFGLIFVPNLICWNKNCIKCTKFAFKVKVLEKIIAKIRGDTVAGLTNCNRTLCVFFGRQVVSIFFFATKNSFKESIWHFELLMERKKLSYFNCLKIFMEAQSV